jgi:hypothetical protein
MEKWPLTDDCANWLKPGNIEAGRIDLESRIATLKEHFEVRYAWWQKAKVATFCLSLTSACYAAYSVTSHELQGNNFAIGWASAGFAAAAVTWNLPSLLQQLPKAWSRPRVFADEALQPLREYLHQLAKSGRSIVTAKGEAVDRAILESDWALLYLTNAPDLKGLPRSIGSGIWIKRYADELLVERPSLPAVVNRDEKPQQVHVHIDNRSIAITINQWVDVTDVHNHFEFVTRLRENVAAHPTRNAETPKSEAAINDAQKRWPCRFETDDYEIRLLIFRTEVLIRLKQVKSHQFQKYVAAIDGARKYWMNDPTLKIDDLADKLGPIVAKSSNGYAGLNKSASVAWIRSLIGGHGKYAFVKESFEAIQYDAEQYEAVQYRMLSE